VLWALLGACSATQSERSLCRNFARAAPVDKHNRDPAWLPEVSASPFNFLILRGVWRSQQYVLTRAIVSEKFPAQMLRAQFSICSSPGLFGTFIGVSREMWTAVAHLMKEMRRCGERGCERRIGGG
jgi:hypothetical protein